MLCGCCLSEGRTFCVDPSASTANRSESHAERLHVTHKCYSKDGKPSVRCVTPGCTGRIDPPIQRLWSMQTLTLCLQGDLQVFLAFSAASLWCTRHVVEGTVRSTTVTRSICPSMFSLFDTHSKRRAVRAEWNWNFDVWRVMHELRRNKFQAVWYCRREDHVCT